MLIFETGEVCENQDTLRSFIEDYFTVNQRLR